MAARYSLAKALKTVRKARGLSQEAFSDVSSRTYMSTLERDLKRLEQASLRQQQTQVFIETPYRNGQVIDTAIKTLLPATLFGIACDLTLPSQFVRCLPVSQWRQSPPPDIHKRPAVFILGTP